MHMVHRHTHRQVPKAQDTEHTTLGTKLGLVSMPLTQVGRHSVQGSAQEPKTLAPQARSREPRTEGAMSSSLLPGCQMTSVLWILRQNTHSLEAWVIRSSWFPFSLWIAQSGEG